MTGQPIASAALTRRSSTPEVFLLGVFRVVLLIVMTASLAGGLGLGIYAVSMYTHKPVPPSEPVPVVVEGIRAEQFLTLIDPPEKPREKSQAGSTGPAPGPAGASSNTSAAATLLYLEDVTALYRCLVDFTKAAGIDTAEANLDNASRQIEAYRLEIQKVADASPSRGAAWVKDAARFVCEVVQTPRMIVLQKEGKVESVASRILTFHVQEWDQRQAEKKQKDVMAAQKSAQERLKQAAAEERNRAEAMRLLMIAGAALATFMALAVFLILVRIEFSLRAMASNPVRLP
ncbi:MAG: hypothetical protein ACO24G_07905 [Burkholderiaceae bacterium]